MNPTTEPATTATSEVPTGMIQGGWEYVNFAYGFSFTCLIAFFFYTTVRMRNVREEST